MYTENDRAEVGSDGGEGTLPFTVPPDNDGGINLGAFHQLVVPEEDLGLDAGGEDLDFSAQMLALVRRPDPQRWFALVQNYWMQTRLLAVASPTSEFGTDWYCVMDPQARSAVRQYMKNVLACPCFLVHSRVWTIWIVSVSPTKWYGSVEPLFRQDPELYTNCVFRVLADRSHGCYHVKHERISLLQPRVTMPSAPTRAVGELLGEALGETRFIRSINHHVIHDLTMGSSTR